MMIRSYDRCSPQDQEVIDAAVLMVEAGRVLLGRFYRDDREEDISEFIGMPEQRIDYLRNLFAVDIKTNPPRYLMWRSDRQRIIGAALDVQRDFAAATDGVSQLSDCIELLTNLPYPQQDGPDSGRKGYFPGR